jgi:hypothetical protein
VQDSRRDDTRSNQIRESSDEVASLVRLVALATAAVVPKYSIWPAQPTCYSSCETQGHLIRLVRFHEQRSGTMAKID